MSMSEMGRKHVVRDIFERGWNRQEFDGLESYLSDEVTFNYRGGQFQTGLAELKDLVSMWRQAFPDLEFTILGIAAEGDLVSINLRLSGTQAGPWKDRPDTGRSFVIDEMMFFRFEGSQIVELWEVMDEYEMNRQLSAD